MYVERTSDGWTFRFREPGVAQLQIDFRFSLLVGDGALIVIEEPFVLRHDETEVLVPPGGDGSEVGAALPLFGQEITAATASSSGELHIQFGNGATASVPVNPAYENWQIVLSDGQQWIGLPGGGVTYITGK